MKHIQQLSLLFSVFLASTSLFAAAPANDLVPDHYIVILSADSNPASVANEMAVKHGLSVRHVYRYALNGFAARIPAGRLAVLQRDSRVTSVSPDAYVSINKKCATPPCKGGGGGEEPPPTVNPQVTPTGVLRINGDLSSTLAGNGSGSVDVDVAVIDSGISNHADLNIAGGINCSKGRASKFADGNGHGTHVSGTVAARDNDLGVVGVAPGARLWAVRVLNNAGSGFTSDVICGIDYVTANADVIEVANMSLGGGGSDTGCSGDAYHQAICNSVAAGVTYVVAAGNEADDASNHRPAAFDEVITVSALADFDGERGGLGSPTCRADEDDTFANFSNFGADVDIIAPGVCIRSTWNDGAYNTISGTSMASPHVAGAAALYKAANPTASPLDVKAALMASGSNDWNSDDDPDGMKESLLDISGF
ncbi:MAG: S8 family serine peptidase [Sulfuriflexus sp.]|nr:S8 family serine peptidase [Sulfuriflexus sp.]